MAKPRHSSHTKKKETMPLKAYMAKPRHSSHTKKKLLTIEQFLYLDYETRRVNKHTLRC